MAAYGYANYLADDAGKTDQYVVGDDKYDKRAYNSTIRHPNTNVYFLLLCRVVMGKYARKKECAPGSINYEQPDHGEMCFPSTPRELSPIKGSDPIVNYHSLLVEPSGGRYREYLSFDGNHIFPEYLIAYTRK